MPLSRADHAHADCSSLDVDVVRRRLGLILAHAPEVIAGVIFPQICLKSIFGSTLTAVPYRK